MSAVEEMSDEEVKSTWYTCIRTKVLKGTPMWVLRLGLEYHFVIEARRKAGLAVNAKMWRRLELAKKQDVAGIKAESEFLTPKYKYVKKEIDMKGKKSKEGKQKASGPTASSLLVGILGQDKVPGDESIIKTVREKTGSTLFDSKQLSWYKWKYRQGKLKGMDGKPHVVAQGDGKKADRPSKPKK